MQIAQQNKINYEFSKTNITFIILFFLTNR